MFSEILPALIAFAFVSSITPGPNNLMLLASGANFGLRRTVPHMFGIGLGFAIMLALVGIGLMGLFDAFPVIYTVLKVGAVLYMLWLAWKIANAGAPQSEQGQAGRPLTFVQAAAFQWVNPKGWAMALTAITLYVPERSPAAIMFVALVFGLVNLPSVGVWAVLGQQMKRFLGSARRLTVFNWTMATLLVASLWPLLQMG